MKKGENQSHFPYHSYLNEAIKYVVGHESGWIMILDDDNTLAKNNSLEILAQRIIDSDQDPKKFYIWKCQKADKIVPSEISFGKTPKCGDIHISCFAFHVSQVDLVFFESKRNGESDVVSSLFNKLSCVWINDILTTAAASGNGLRRDLPAPVPVQAAPENKKKITLKPAPASAPVPAQPTAPSQPKVGSQSKIQSKIQSKTQSKTQSKIQIGPKKKVEQHVPVVTEIDDMDDDDDDDDGEIIEDETDDEAEAVSDEDEEEIIDVDEDDQNSDEEVIVDEPAEPPVEPPKSAEVTPKPVAVTSKVSAVASIPITAPKQEIPELAKLVTLLSSGQKVYILDEANMKQLSKCLQEAFTCVELEEKLVRILEGKLLETKNAQIKNKIGKLTSDSSGPASTQAPAQVSVQVPAQVLPRGSSDELIDHIYLITTDNSLKNSNLERNKKILGGCKIENEIVVCKDVKLYHYQNQIKEIIMEAKKNGYRRIMILNGDDLFNTKFVGLLDRQMGKIVDDECYLWFLGNNKETSPKDIVNTKFELEDYLFMYDDIVTAKYTTTEKAKTHWKSYGHREARYGAIDVVQSPPQAINCNHGFVIAAELYDQAITLIDKQNQKDCKNFLVELQKSHVETKKVWFSRPDLIIPSFSNPSASSKNIQTSLKNGWYYNFYK